MKTAMQELIEHFTFYTGNYSSREEILSKGKQLIEKEKEQVKEAYTNGFYAGCDQPLMDKMPEGYYNETFETTP